MKSLAAFLFIFCAVAKAQTTGEITNYLVDKARLTPRELARIRSGQPVAKILPSAAPTIYVFGVVHVRANPADFFKFATDIERLRRLPQYLGVGRVGPGSTPSDLNGFDLEADDIRELSRCKPGNCEIQLPGEAISQFRKSVDWSKPDVAAQVNQRNKTMTLEVLRRYSEGGNRQLGAYFDREKEVDIAQRFQALLSGAPQLGEHLPELTKYLLDYPGATLPRSESTFYWERVNFGMKPTLRLNHAISWSTRGPRGDLDVFAIKQLYASHYFQVALDLSVCLQDGASGFYLITLKGTTQAGLTGFSGAIIRTIITSRTRVAQETVLAGIKSALERR